MGTISATAGTTVSFADLNTALGRSSTAQISFNDTELRRTVQNTTSGNQISIDGSRGYSRINLSVSGTTYAYNLKTQCDNSGYSAGKSYVTLTINSGAKIGGSPGNNSNSSLSIAGFVSGDDVTVTNNGTIMGYGGFGGTGASGPGGPGGQGIYCSNSVTVYIVNNGYIAGGGGGGAGGIYYWGSSKFGGSWEQYGGGGGGGAGLPGGTGGNAQSGNINGTIAQAGGSGSEAGGGSGGTGGAYNTGVNVGSTGSSGGAIASGGSGSSGTWPYPLQYGTSNYGGPPGFGIHLQANTTGYSLSGSGTVTNTLYA